MKVRVKEVNPLKQGLKPVAETTNSLTVRIVKEVNPLKQGLKQASTRNTCSHKYYS